MSVIKFDVSSSDPEAAEAGSFESPKPGIYAAKIKSMTPGYSKGGDGKEDKSRPRIEVVFQITDRQFKGSQMWYYLTFGENALWKLDQFLQVFGLANKNKRTGEMDTNKLVNKPCRLRVKAGKDLDGNYRGDIAAVLKPGEDGGSGEDEGDIFSEPKEEAAADLNEMAEEQEDTPTDASDDEIIEDEIIEEVAETIQQLSEDDLKAMPAAELGPLAKEMGIVTKGKKKSEVIAEIMAGPLASEDDDEMPF